MAVPSGSHATITDEALRPIPWPEDSAMEVAIREQLQSVRSLIESQEGRTEMGREELADLYGTAGQVYLVYSLVDSAEATSALNEL